MESDDAARSSGPADSDRRASGLPCEAHQEQPVSAGYEACKTKYADVTEENYVAENIVSPVLDQQERRRLEAALELLPDAKAAARKVLELGGGYGRNQPLLREFYAQAEVLMIEQSQANIAIAASKMLVPEADCLCASVQDVPWDAHVASVDVIVDWWTLSYLEVADVGKVLRGVQQALRPDGVFVVCLSVTLRPGNRGGPMDVGMHNRMQSDYEDLFKAAGLESHGCLPKPREYGPVSVKALYHQCSETVWVLTPSQ